MLFEKEMKTLPNLPGTRTEMFGVAAVQNSAFTTKVSDDASRQGNVQALKDLYAGIGGAAADVKDCVTELEVLNKISGFYEGATNATTVAEAIANINAAEYNPLAALTIDGNVPTTLDLFGKKVTDLQKDIVIKDGVATGELLYVTGYTGFSGDPSEQQGNYIALHVDVPDVEDVTYTVNGNTLDSDQVIVLIVKNKDKKVVVTASKLGKPTITKEISLKKLKYDK